MPPTKKTRGLGRQARSLSSRFNPLPVSASSSETSTRVTRRGRSRRTVEITVETQDNNEVNLSLPEVESHTSADITTRNTTSHVERARRGRLPGRPPGRSRAVAPPENMNSSPQEIEQLVSSAIRVETARRGRPIGRSRTVASSRNISVASSTVLSFRHVESNSPNTTTATENNTILVSSSPEVDVLESFTPPRMRTRRPVQVDLTCDEVHVLLEDVNNTRSRRSVSPLPVVLSSNVTRSIPMTTSRKNPDLVDCSLSDGSTVSASTSTPSSTSEISNGIQCPICLDSLAQMKAANVQLNSTVCGHIFCGPCITRVISSSNRCPTCRIALTLKQIHPVFI